MYVRSGAEEQDHDERVREAHLGAVHGAVARRLDEGEYVMVPRVECQTLQPDLSLLSPKHCQLIPLFSLLSALCLSIPRPLLFSFSFSRNNTTLPPFFPDIMFVDVKGVAHLEALEGRRHCSVGGGKMACFVAPRYDGIYFGEEGRRARTLVRQEVVGVNRIVSQLPHEEKNNKKKRKMICKNLY